jgi:hypothetical protein
LRQRGARNAADELSFILHRTRMTAIKEHANAGINVDKGANQYSIVISRFNEPDRTLETFDLSQYAGGVVFTDAPIFTDNTIQFSSTGVADIPGVILLTNAANTETFRLRVTGAGGISQHLYNEADGTWH